MESDHDNRVNVDSTWFCDLPHKPGVSQKEQESQLVSERIRREAFENGKFPSEIREMIIRDRMSKREDEYTFTQTLRVFIGTWNVNGQPPTVELTEWLSCDVDPPDIYAIGFQELDLSKEAFLFNDSPLEKIWIEKVKKALHSGAKYWLVRHVRLVGMLLIIFVQDKHCSSVRDVSICTVGTGIMGKMGNKGGVSVRLQIHSTSVCFVNSHLAAHIEEYERRNQDYRDICERTRFSGSSKMIKDHEQVYWLGDLNYRVTGLPHETVKQYVYEGNFKPVLEYDQLVRQQREGRAFGDFKEGVITFWPTYKYDTGTDNWDSSEKSRAPAWCDRVLWKGALISQLEYRSHPLFKISDHKPVSSIFDSKFRVVDPVKYRKVHEEVMKKVDKYENEFLPQVMVDTNEVNFGNVHFWEKEVKYLTIANTGQVAVSFKFINKLDDVSYCKEWLHIEPHYSTIQPGDTCDVGLEICVDKKYAHKLNSGREKLYDILVLHLIGGKDIFITVSGKYERSCFGTSLETLANINVPFKELSVADLQDLEKGGKKGCEYPVPREVWFLVDHLYRHALKQPQLFENSGLRSEFVQIRNWLDYGSQDPLPGSISAISEALLLLLDSAPEPVIPFQFQEACLSAASLAQAGQVIQQLPQHSKNLFLYLCSFLRELLAHSQDNGLDMRTLGILFGGIFLRDETEMKSRAAQQAIDRKKANFVCYFLLQDYYIISQ